MLVAGIVVGLVLGAALLLGVMQLLGRSSLGEAAARRDELLNGAKREAENLRREAEIEAREQAVRVRAEAERDAQERRVQITRLEERVIARQDELEAKLTELLRREQGLADRETHIKELQGDLKEVKDRELGELERISGLTVNEAKAELLDRAESLIRHELARRVRQLEEEAQLDARSPSGKLDQSWTDSEASEIQPQQGANGCVPHLVDEHNQSERREHDDYIAGEHRNRVSSGRQTDGVRTREPEQDRNGGG